MLRERASEVIPVQGLKSPRPHPLKETWDPGGTWLSQARQKVLSPRAGATHLGMGEEKSRQGPACRSWRLAMAGPQATKTGLTGDHGVCVLSSLLSHYCPMSGFLGLSVRPLVSFPFIHT